MGTTLTPRGDAPQVSFDELTRARLAAEQSPLPCIISTGTTHAIRFANRAACEGLGREVAGSTRLPLPEHFRAAAEVKEVLDRAATTLVTQVLTGVDYVHPADGLRRCTLTVTPMLDRHMRLCGLVSQLLVEKAADTTTELLHELKAANERLLVAALREQELADEARRREMAMKALLARESIRAQASAALGATLSYEETLQQIARLAVPKLADYCVVNALDRGAISETACAHHDLVQEQLLQASSATRTGFAEYGVAGVISTGKAVLYPAVESSTWLARSIGCASADVFEELGAGALLCLPLKVRNVVLGVMCVVRTESSPPFYDDELKLFDELAERASVALDNANLYRNMQAAVQQRDDVLAVVSHDLRSPLSAIRLSASALLQPTSSDPSEELQRPLQLILRTTQHMLAMIDELLDYAGIQAHKLVLHCERTDLTALIDEALQMLQPMAEQKGVHLERHLPAAAAYVWCDAERVLRTLTNLVGNALKFTPRDGSVGVELIEGVDELEINVFDNGPGVSQENLGKLFEPYWAGARASGSGTGLGLYSARGIVHAHGGRIWVESKPGAGAAFHFTLPKPCAHDVISRAVQ